ncbi:MAG: hypothetical protein JST11_25565 [Acidobacteria bacterium]|nr:hypothetical protein [Acidobacteriota bacterium]
MRLILFTMAMLTLPLAAQPGRGWRGGAGAGAGAGQGEPAVALLPVVEISGVVSSVHIGFGQGMPYLEVKHGEEMSRVYLGAMHYLIAENFNPKAGQQITAKGYRSGDSLIGIQVTLPAEKKTLKLRDEKGWPLWRGPGWRQGPADTKGGNGAS